MQEYPHIKGDLVECQDCSAHFQTDPRGDIQSGPCPDCGGTRMLLHQPSPTQSDGTIRNMPEAGGEDPGGNPEGTGIRTPTVRSPLSAYPGGTFCNHCHADMFGMEVCPHCQEPNGLPQIGRAHV